MTQKTVNLKQLLRAFTLGVALVVGAGSVFSQNASTAAVNQPVTQDIEQTWKSSPEFTRFNELGGEKSDEAMRIREKAVKKIAEEKLRPFTDGFDERIREINKNKIATYPPSIQVILANAYEAGFPLIKEKSQRNINVFNSRLITYIDNVYDGTGKAEQAAQSLLKRFPELEGSEFQRRVLTVGHNADQIGKHIDEKKTWDEINRLLKSFK